VRFPHASLELPGEPFDTILARAVEGPVTVADLRRVLPRFDVERIREALVDLLASEQLAPVVTPDPGRPFADAHAYNMSVLSEPLSASHPVVLAAPLVGSGLHVPALQAVCLRLLHLVPPEDRATWLRAFVERQPVKLSVANRPVTDQTEQVRIISGELERFRVQRLSKLVALGVVRDTSTH
jgi:hypothetical protein